MRFIWDERKKRRNIAKHKIDFATAILVFDDPHAVSRLQRIEDGEERWRILGLAGGIVVLFVAYTYMDNDEEVIRIISARKATPRERKVYEENL